VLYNALSGPDRVERYGDVTRRVSVGNGRPESGITLQ
jgi:hypothetical protein